MVRTMPPAQPRAASVMLSLLVAHLRPRSEKGRGASRTALVVGSSRRCAAALHLFFNCSGPHLILAELFSTFLEEVHSKTLSLEEVHSQTPSLEEVHLVPGTIIFPRAPLAGSA